MPVRTNVVTLSIYCFVFTALLLRFTGHNGKPMWWTVNGGPLKPNTVISSSPSVFIASSLIFPPPLSASATSRFQFNTTGRKSTLLVLLLIGGIESNPGPVINPKSIPAALHRQQRLKSGGPRPLACATLNVRSAVNKAAELHDVIESANLDVLVLTETWIARNAPTAVKHDIAPLGYGVHHVHRSVLRTRGQKVGMVKGGGGLAVIYRDSLKVSDCTATFGKYDSFEAQHVRLTVWKQVHQSYWCISTTAGC